MDDLISRKAAIDAIMDADVCVTWNGVISDDDAVDIAIKSTKGSVISSIVNLPSAQPETHDKCTKTHACDLIDRQVAIDAFYKHPNIDWTTLDVLAKINALPPTQPDLSEYSDKLWKKAYERGKAEALAEIIRCKDCKYWNDEFAKDKSTCWLPCMSMTTHREWHCGSAERRTDDCV